MTTTDMRGTTEPCEGGCGDKFAIHYIHPQTGERRHWTPGEDDE